MNQKKFLIVLGVVLLLVCGTFYIVDQQAREEKYERWVEIWSCLEFDIEPDTITVKEVPMNATINATIFNPTDSDLELIIYSEPREIDKVYIGIDELVPITKGWQNKLFVKAFEYKILSIKIRIEGMPDSIPKGLEHNWVYVIYVRLKNVTFDSPVRSSNFALKFV